MLINRSSFRFVLQLFDNSITENPRDSILCFKDFEVSEEAFLRQIENPRSPGNEAFQILFNDFMDEFVF